MTSSTASKKVCTCGQLQLDPVTGNVDALLCKQHSNSFSKKATDLALVTAIFDGKKELLHISFCKDRKFDALTYTYKIYRDHRGNIMYAAINCAERNVRRSLAAKLQKMIARVLSTKFGENISARTVGNVVARRA
jgi:hypothetical protein